MADTVRTLSALQALFADNSAGDISPQDLRDFLVTAFSLTDALDARVTALEAGFPGTPTAKWGAYHPGWPPASDVPSIHSYGMDALTAAVGISPQILHWYSQAGGWDGATNSSSYNWAGVQSNVAACLAAGVAPMITWEFFGTFENGPVRRNYGAQDFPLKAFQSAIAVSGTANAAVSTTNTTLTDTRAAWTTNMWAGQMVTCNGKAMVVNSNTGTVMTGAAWSGGSNPGNGSAWSIRPVGFTKQNIYSNPDGTGMTSNNTTLTQSGATWTVNEFVGATVYTATKSMVITSNTATVLTGSAWSGGSNPGNAAVYNIGPTPNVTAAAEWNSLQAYVDDWATGLASLKATYGSAPIYLRIFHEHNLVGNQWSGYPWSVYAGNGMGNTSAQYIAAWQWVVSRFVAAGADNVKWVWNPGGDLGPNPIPTGSYPGDAYVDFIGADIYNTSPAGTVPTDYTTLAATTLGGTATSGKRMIFGEIGIAATANGGTTDPMTYLTTDIKNMLTTGAARIEAIVWWDQPQYALTVDNATGTGVTTNNTTLTDASGAQFWGTNEWAGATVTCNGKTATVSSNTSTVLTVASWSGGGNPGNGFAYTMKLANLCAQIVPVLG